MRQIVLDTETTGFSENRARPAEGHRIVEIAALEIKNRQMTGQIFHRHLNPGRPVDPGALAIHGLDDARLRGEPRFAEVAEELLAFLRGGVLIIHNAPFDLAFLEQELCLAQQAPLARVLGGETIDTLVMARRMYPGKRHSLDKLCDHLGVDRSQRHYHGALIDCALLAQVYLAMTRGQASFLTEENPASSQTLQGAPAIPLSTGLAARANRVIAPDAAEIAAHERYLEALDQESRGACVWRGLAPRS